MIYKICGNRVKILYFVNHGFVRHHVSLNKCVNLFYVHSLLKPKLYKNDLTLLITFPNELLIQACYFIESL